AYRGARERLVPPHVPAPAEHRRGRDRGDVQQRCADGAGAEGGAAAAEEDLCTAGVRWQVGGGRNDSGSPHTSHLPPPTSSLHPSFSISARSSALSRRVPGLSST